MLLGLSPQSVDSYRQNTLFFFLTWLSCSRLVLDRDRHVVVARVIDIDGLNWAGRGHTYAALRVCRHRGLLHLSLRLHCGVVFRFTAYCRRVQLFLRSSEQLNVGGFVVEGYGRGELVVLGLSAHRVKASVANHITQLARLFAAFLAGLV